MKNTLRTMTAFALAFMLCGFQSIIADPIEISDWHDLHNMRDDMEQDTEYVLVNDLDQETAGYGDYNNGDGWEPIGDSGDRFMATLDGQGYAITGLTIVAETALAGLFGQTHFATIKDLKILDANITTSASNAGVLVGTAAVTDVENVTVSGTITATGHTTNLGGLIGRQEGGLVFNSVSYVDLDVEGRMVGGISGTMTSQAEIEQSFYIGNITTSAPSDMNRWIGGVTGQFGGKSMITDAYAIGDISGTHIVGGLIGYHWRGGSTITNSYHVGLVEGDPEHAPTEDDDPVLNVGGITGYSNPPQEADDGESKVVNTFWNTEVSGIDISYGGGEYPTDQIGEGKTTAELKDQDTFTDWDFADVWAMEEDLNEGYPFLQFATPEDDPPPGPPIVDSSWDFQRVIPSDTAISSSHGVAFDAAGNIWTGPYYSIVPEEGERINPVYCYTQAGEPCADVEYVYSVETGDSTLRFGPITAVATDHNGDILINSHGYRSSAEGNPWNSSRTFLIRIDHENGEGLGVGEITHMRTETAAHSMHHAVDEFGYIFYSAVFPGEPIRVLDENFDPVLNVIDNRPGFARAIEVSRDGSRVYQPTNYGTEFVDNGDTTIVSGRLAVYEGDVFGTYEPLDTMSFIGMDPGAVAVDPITGVIYVPASGSGNNPEGDPERWDALTIYGIKVLGQGDYEVVDQLSWDQGDGDIFNPIYRALGISADGLSIAVGGFSTAGAGVQLFTRTEVSAEDFVTYDEIPEGVELEQNYPNPFNPATTIRYTIPENMDVRLDVYNVAGQRVATLVNEMQNAGSHTVTFDASQLASGVYIYRITAGNYVESRKMMFIK